MARDNRIRVDDDEHAKLAEYRRDEYGTDDIPFGVVISDLIDNARGVRR